MKHLHPCGRAAVDFVLLTGLATDAAAYGSFKTAEAPTLQVFCDEANVAVAYVAQQAKYTAGGTCVGLSSPPGRQDNGYSEFPDTNHATQLFKAAWTATGDYDPVTKETHELITLPAPGVDEATAPGRPYGHFGATMVCATDPWLDPAAGCTAIRITATGNLGMLETELRRLTVPFTSQSKPAQRQALIDANRRAVQIAGVRSTTATVNQTAQVFVQAPQILAPLANATHRMGSPFAVRVAPGQPLRATYYQLDFEHKDAQSREWQPVASVSVPAADLEGPSGYSGWHAPGPGTYRLHARVVQPATGAPGDWRAFDVAGLDIQTTAVDRSQAVQATVQPPWGASTVPQRTMQPTPYQPRPGPAAGNVAPSSLGSR